MLSAFFLLAFTAEPQNLPPKTAIFEFDKQSCMMLTLSSLPLGLLSYWLDVKFCERFPNFDFLGPGESTLWSTLLILPMIPTVFRSFKTLSSHAEEVKQQLLHGYGSGRLTVINLTHNPFQKVDVISNSTGGVFLPYWLFLNKAKEGTIFFCAASNDGEPITSSLYSRNQANTNFLSLLSGRFNKRFNIWCLGERNFQKHPNVIHCGVASKDELGLETYSNFPSENSKLRFLAITLPEGCPPGTSYATPIIAGIFCKLKSLYPQIADQKIINLMYSTAKYISNDKAIYYLSRYANSMRHLTTDQRKDFRERIIADLKKTIEKECGLKNIKKKLDNYGNNCVLYCLLQNLLTWTSRTKVSPPDEIILRHNWLSHGQKIMIEGTEYLLKTNPPFHILNKEKLFDEAEKRWKPTQNSDHKRKKRDRK